MSAAHPDFWIAVTCAAAFFQNLRFILQKQLSMATLSAAGATFARFVYSAPLAAVLLVIYLHAIGQPLPETSARFWLAGTVGGAAQVGATVCVVQLFKARNFAVGITLMKTQVIFAVAVGAVLLGEVPSLAGLGAICLGLVGVLLLTEAASDGTWTWRALTSRAMLLGLASGVLFAVSAVCYRAATLEIASEDPLVRSGITLSAVTAMQTLGMVVWLAWREPGQVGAVWRARRRAVWVGLLSMAGSLGWFTAFALQTAAYVKAVGQVELVFSLIAATLLFGERVTARELAGMAVLCLSIVLLVLVT
ncbi:DMT family transporter [Sulfitobacter sp. D35]|uniref:DMT family transporter n=1 Tax=Sulfitobacter sp. D35 TaxID=3083252 RepID=UPI00296FD837|nr:DMT family transporter [Sulfitobacter sp. D35]MDW4496624.1 DMT family transporter [Sulfitobacter sp. D35]